MVGIPTIDLFAGAGGLSIGASRAGADVRLAVDLDPMACDTLSSNRRYHVGEVAQADVTTLSGRDLRRRADVSSSDQLIVIGGPPCQPFSKAAYWVESGAEARYRLARAHGQVAVRPNLSAQARPDARRDLVAVFMRLVLDSKADAFLLENVPSILHPRNRHVVEEVVRAAEAGGYRVRMERVNAAEYGVPQRRSRVVILGSRGQLPEPSRITHGLTPDLLPIITAGQALEPFAGREWFEPEEAISGRWADHLSAIPPGWNYKHHTAWAGHPNPTFETETRFWNFLLKLDPARPSWTVAANPGPWTGPFHWQTRRLRTAELAALQAFPSDYLFAGNRRDRVRQIGNAVPPPLAEMAVRALMDSIDGRAREVT
jgi:DNA (cytosine-5)-methyltransferase 1